MGTVMVMVMVLVYDGSSCSDTEQRLDWDSAALCSSGLAGSLE